MTTQSTLSNSTTEIMINGEPRTIAQNTTVAALIAELGLKPERLAIEYNLEILPRRTWDETILKSGDRLEIVHFVGGGSH